MVARGGWGWLGGRSGKGWSVNRECRGGQEGGGGGGSGSGRACFYV